MMDDSDTESDYVPDDDEDPTFVPQQALFAETHLRLKSPKSVPKADQSEMEPPKPLMVDDPSILQDPNTEDHNKKTIARPDQPAPMKGFAHEKLAGHSGGAKVYAAPVEQPKTRKVQGARGEDVEVSDVATQAPEEAPEEPDFDLDDIEVEPEQAPEIRPKVQNLAAPTAMEQALAGEYDPDKFWGYDLMFQFPWDTVENLFQARNFRQEKPEKTENEMMEDDEHAKLSPRSRKIEQDYSPEMFAARCQAAGLHTDVSSDPEHIYIRVGATWSRYETEAERTKFRKRLKEEWFNPGIEHRDIPKMQSQDPGLHDEDPIRPMLWDSHMGDRKLMLYAEFDPTKRVRFANSLLSPNSLFSSGERQRLCQSIVEAPIRQGGAGINIDADSAVWGYLAGAPICLPDYEERDRLEKLWCGGKPFGSSPNVFWRYQPLHEIREYYGEAITLYYAWMDHYITWLVAPSIVGSICWIVYHLREYWSFLENATIVYGTFIMFWGIFFMEAWNRREADLCFMWDTLDRTTGYREYFDFANRATRRRNPVTYEEENYFDDEIRSSRVNKSLMLMAFFMLLGLSFNVGSLMLGGYLQEEITFNPGVGPAIGALALVTAQQVTKFVWEIIATALTDWETHKYVADYDQQIGFKMFGFELVMKFGAIFFIAFFKGPLGEYDITGLRGCLDKDGNETGVKFCDYELMMQLLIVFMAEMTVGQFTEVVIPMLKLYIINRINNAKEAEAAEAAKAAGVGGDADSKEDLGAGTGTGSQTGFGAGVGVKMDEVKVENPGAGHYQCKASEIRNLSPEECEERNARMEELYNARAERGQPWDEWITEDQENEAEKDSFWMAGGPNLDYQEMMIQFGFVTLFSLGFPIVPFLALLNNLVEIRTDSLGMNETCQRPQYRMAPDIGAWKGALNFMVWSSIVFNMLLMLYFNQYKSDHQYFNGTDNLTLVGVVIGAEHVVIFFKLLCETYIPDRTKWLVEALDGADALVKRALKDYPPKENNYSKVEGIGNLSARKEHVMNMSTWKKGAIETHFKMYPELKKMRAEVRKEWQETLAEARDEWKQKAEQNAELATPDE